ncbi:hypothetical protein BDF20DRAFT_903338 [Mycotypha africana]|uniref:uncharacterized protein n=1 Tax=Mycotypha africana TaxID=64632 RepID=UPI0023016A06|nr:uncharacterized protein BDF20DRAFT_903338 [Mycotypha africana]KAI8966943.1 hypothetical protein BDF20DRAFT_903338 [Mycotypha africana]
MKLDIVELLHPIWPGLLRPLGSSFGRCLFLKESSRHGGVLYPTSSHCYCSVFLPYQLAKVTLFSLRLCCSATESTYYFVSHCYLKWLYWQKALAYCSLFTEVRSPHDVGLGISTFHNASGNHTHSPSPLHRSPS